MSTKVLVGTTHIIAVGRLTMQLSQSHQHLHQGWKIPRSLLPLKNFILVPKISSAC